LNDNALELLLNKAKKQEEKYEWLQATKLYNEAADLALKKRAKFKAAELQEKKGFCFYRAAFQAQTNIEFQRLLKKSIQAYQKEVEILEGKEVDNQTNIKHANALIACMRSWLETNPTKKKKMLEEWWSIEKQLLSIFERDTDLYSVGKTCNDLVELSHDMFFVVSDYTEREKMFKEATGFAEKAIQIFSELDEEYELARAYCFASWYYGFSGTFFEDQDKIMQLAKKCHDYADKALEISQKIGDAWLISRSYHSAWSAATFFNMDPLAAAEIGQNMLKYGSITKDNFVMGFGNCLAGTSTTGLFIRLEDPDRQREVLKKGVKMIRKALRNFQIINQIAGSSMCYMYQCLAFATLAQIEIDLESKQTIFENTTKIAEEAIDVLKNWQFFLTEAFQFLTAITGKNTVQMNLKNWELLWN